MSHLTAVANKNVLDQQFLNDVLNGLTQRQKSLPCKYFYDDRGAALFEQITSVSEYYVTRTELSILDKYSHAIAQLLPQDISIRSLLDK